MDKPEDLVESLIRTAGRRAEPPEEARQQVLAAATAAFREKTAHRNERLWLLWAGAAATLVFAIALMMRWAPPTADREELASVERIIGSAEQATGDVWRPLGENPVALTSGMKLRTNAGGLAGLKLAGGASLRLATETEIMLDAPGRLYLKSGTIYLDNHGSLGTGYRVETPAGTARDLGTQFELRVASGTLRLRVREGRVEIDRAGQLVSGAAGEQLEIDALGGVTRLPIEASDTAWLWAESVAPTPDVDGKPASVLIDWVARETGRRVVYASTLVEERAASVILHGNIRHLAPLVALDAMLATTDLEYVLLGDTMEIRTRDTITPLP